MGLRSVLGRRDRAGTGTAVPVVLRDWPGTGTAVPPSLEGLGLQSQAMHKDRNPQSGTVCVLAPATPRTLVLYIRVILKHPPPRSWGRPIFEDVRPVGGCRYPPTGRHGQTSDLGGGVGGVYQARTDLGGGCR